MGTIMESLRCYSLTIRTELDWRLAEPFEFHPNRTNVTEQAMINH